MLRHNSNPLSFQCSQPPYKPHHFIFSSFQRKFIKRTDGNIQFKAAFFKATHFSKSRNDSYDPINSYSVLKICTKKKLFKCLKSPVERNCLTKQYDLRLGNY